MAISVVQTQSNSAATTNTLTVTLTSTTAQNTLIVAVASAQSGSGNASSVTSGGQNLTAAVQQSELGEATAEVWYLDNIAGGQTSVTITWGGTVGSVLAVAYEVSGVYAAGGSLDKTSTGVNTGSSPTTFNSGTTATLSQSSEIAIGCAAIFGLSSTVTGPSSPWTNTQPTHVSFGYQIAGRNIVSATTGLAYSGSYTHSGTGDVAAVIATFKAGTPPPPGPSLTVAQVTMAAPAPSTGAGPMALTVAQEAEAAPAPAVTVALPLTVAQVNVAALPVQLPVFLPVAQVNVAAPVVTPTIGVVLAIPAAQVTLSAPSPALGGSTIALTASAVNVAAPAPGLSIGKNVNLTVAAEAVSARPPTPSVNIVVALTTAQVTVAARPPKASRQLLIALASAAGTDDYGTAFPEGILATAGVIEGPTLIGSDAFFYSPSPGAGNLTQSIAEADGVDQFGNAYIAGTATYANNGGFWSAVVIADGVVNWYMATSEAGPWTSEAGIGFSWNNLTGGGLEFTGPAGNDMTGDLNVSGSITVTTSLVVAGTDVASALNAIQAALSGASTSTNGLADGTIHGTSGGASTGTAHTHGPGSFAVGSGQHSHTLPTF